MDYSKEHVKQMPGKNTGATSKPSAGAGATPNHKQHERTVALGEGLEMGAAHEAHTKETVMDAKYNPAPRAASQAQRTRVISGNSNTMGEGSVTKQENGHQAHIKSNSKVQQKAHGFNERSIAGNANPSACPDCD